MLQDIVFSFLFYVFYFMYHLEQFFFGRLWLSCMLVSFFFFKLLLLMIIKNMTGYYSFEGTGKKKKKLLKAQVVNVKC